jgi:hypothetical protein
MLTVSLLSTRSAYRLAGSFNLRGRLRQLFHVLTDDKIGSGPRPAPHSLQHTSKPTPNIAQEGGNQAVTAAATASSADPADSDTSVKSLPGGSKQVKRKAEDVPASRGKNRR